MIGIVIGDLHDGLEYKGISFSERIEKCVDQVVEECEIQKGKMAFITLLGDIIHLAGMNPDLMISIINTLRKLDVFGCPIFVLQGNHDIKTRSTGKNTLFDVMKQVEFNNVHFLDFPTLFNLAEKDGCNYDLVFVPYGLYDLEDSLAKVHKVIKELDENREGKPQIIAFTHHDLPQEHSSYKHGSEVDMKYGRVIIIPESLLISDRVVKIINGHIHTPNTIGKIEMPGSLEVLRFGEGKERYFLKVDLS